MPSYSLHLWNERDIPDHPAFHKFLEKGEWSKASDFARWFIMMSVGGIYLDTDIELIKPLDLLPYRNFLGFDSLGGRVEAAVLKFEDSAFPTLMFKKMQELTGDETIDILAGMTTKMIRRCGLIGYSFQPQEICGVTILPKQFFYADKLTEESYCYHHRLNHWRPVLEREQQSLVKK